MADRGSSRIDYVVEVDGEDGVLLEAKSPSVMNNVRGLLPQNDVGSRSNFGAEHAYKGEYAIVVTYNAGVQEIHVGCIVFGSKTDGMALYYLP